jgi:hypothetical protein
MTRKQNLTEFIQIRVNAEEKAFIQLMAKKFSSKGVSALILNLLYNELGRVSRIDEEINEARKKLMEVQY